MNSKLSKLAIAALMGLVAAGSLTACEHGKADGKKASQKERNKCKGSN